MLVSLAWLAGCGGPADDVSRAAGPSSAGDAPSSSSPIVAEAEAPSSVSPAPAIRRRTLNATVADATADTLFDWAERTYPSLFPGHPATQLASPYIYRHYPSTGVYLGIWTNDVYAMGGPFGPRPSRVGQVASFWGLAVTKSPESACWNLDLMFTQGALIDVEWSQTGKNVKPQGTETQSTSGPSEWEGKAATQFWRTVDHKDAAGSSGRTGRVYMRRTGPHEVTWLAEVFTEADIIPGVGVRNQIGGIDAARPGRVDGFHGLAPGQSASTRYTLSRTVTIVGDSPAQTHTRVFHEDHAVTTRIASRESVVVPAGRYDTCRVEQTDTAQPGRLVTTWVAAGRGIPVQRVITENGVVVMTQRATAVRVNHKRV